MMPEKVSDLLAEYESVAEAWSLVESSDAEAANRLFIRSHELAKYLRLSREGRGGLERIAATASSAGLELLAACDCLPFAPEVAVPILERIELAPGLHAVSAKYTLKSFRAGTLNFDW